MKSVPEHAGQALSPFRSGLSNVSRTKRTLPVSPAADPPLSWPMSASVNSLSPVPSTAVRNVVPSADVSSLYSRVVADAPSPQPVDGFIRNAVMSIVSGSSIATVGGPVCGLPGSALVGLNADQPVPCDWSRISRAAAERRAGVVADAARRRRRRASPPSRACMPRRAPWCASGSTTTLNRVTGS